MPKTPDVITIFTGKLNEINTSYETQEVLLKRIIAESENLLKTLVDDKGLIRTLSDLSQTSISIDTTEFNNSLEFSKRKIEMFSDKLNNSISSLEGFSNTLLNGFSGFLNILTPVNNELGKLGVVSKELNSNQDIFNQQMLALKNATNSAVTNLNNIGSGGRMSSGGGYGGGGMSSGGGYGHAALSGVKKIVDIPVGWISGGFNQIAKASLHPIDAMDKLQKAVYPLNTTLQLSNQGLTDLTVSMGKTASHTVWFGKDMKDLGEIQQKIISLSGRSTIIAGEDLKKTALMARFTSNEFASQFTDNMNKIGVSVSDSYDHFDNIAKKSAKSGVDMKKATELVDKNLHRAQSYAFKNGVQSLTNMVNRSLQLRMNMDSVFKFADINNELESSIENAAKLQVLGGTIATAFGDPLRNLYNSMFDQEAIQKDFEKVGRGMMRFDRKRGTMVANSPLAEQQLNQLAKQLGKDPHEFRNELSRSGLIAQMEREKGKKLGLDKKGFTENEINLVKTKANFDAKQKAWTVAVLNKKTGEFENKNINQLTKEDIKSVKAEDRSLEEIGKSTLSILEKWDAGMNWTQNNLGTTMEKTVGVPVQKGYNDLSKFLAGSNERTAALLTALVSVAGLILSAVALKSVSNLFRNSGRNIGRNVGRNNVIRQAAPRTRMIQNGQFVGRTVGAAKMGKTATQVGTAARGLGGVARIGGGALGVATTGLMVGMDIYNFKKYAKESDKDFHEKKGKTYGGAAGAATGALAGAAIGSVVPIIGTALGAGIGATIGYFGGGAIGKNKGQKRDEEKEYRQQMLEATRMRGPNITNPNIVNNIMKHEGRIGLNVGGSIKLESNSSSSIDTDKLLKDTRFISAITDKVAAQIRTNIGHGKTDNRGGQVYGAGTV